MKKALAVILSLICLAALPSCGFTASAENAADDDTDCHVKDVAFEGKLFEFAPEFHKKNSFLKNI